MSERNKIRTRRAREGPREPIFRQLLKQLPEAVLVLSRGRIRFANHAAATLLGARSTRHLQGLQYNTFVVFSGSMPGAGEHQKLRKLDGSLIDVEAIMEGPETMRRVVLRDLTRYVVTENALRRSEERLRLLAEDVHDRGIMTLDRDGRIQSWSTGAERITCHHDTQAVGQYYHLLFTEEQIADERPARLLRAAAQHRRSEHEGWKPRADGSLFYGTMSVVALYDRQHAVIGYAVMIRDLTAHTALDAIESGEQQRQAQRMESVGRLTSGVAHDFNNLLTAIQGHAEFLLKEFPADHPLRAEAQEIVESTERASALTRQLLHFGRGQTVDQKRIDINKVVTSIERMLRRIIGESVTLKTTLQPALPAIAADASQMEQVLVNVVVNARDAMPNGGTITIATSTIDLSDSYLQQHYGLEDGSYVLVSITDTGIGMSAETQRHIFEPFFSTKGSGKGTGLGLSTVDSIVRQYGGYITVTSETGRGTTFNLYFPTIPDEAKSGVRTPSGKMTKGGETVLLVEDDASVRRLAGRVLKMRGYKVLMAASLAEAQGYLTRSADPIALVVTDAVLPDGRGPAVIANARSERPGCRVLMMSGYGADDIAANGAAPFPFIEKPFSPDAFAQKVRAVLDDET